MAVSERHQQPLRVPRELAGAVKKQADRRGISFNAYTVQALEEKLDRDRERSDLAEDRRRARDKPREPRGLGLGLRSLSPAEAAPPLPPLEQPAVVVKLSSGAGEEAPAGGLVAGLVAYVASAPVFSREQYKRRALEVLQAQGSSPQAREQLASQFSAQLERALAEQSPARLRPQIGRIGSLFQR